MKEKVMASGECHVSQFTTIKMVRVATHVSMTVAINRCLSKGKESD